MSKKKRLMITDSNQACFAKNDWSKTSGRTFVPFISCTNHSTYQEVGAKLAVGGGSNPYFYSGPSHSCHGRKNAYLSQISP